MTDNRYGVSGAGIGYRRCMGESLRAVEPGRIDFLEVAPENWIGLGGRFGRQFREYAERYPVLAHGLSLSLGGPTPLDSAFLDRLKQFFAEYGIRGYSEHLSYCTDGGHLYDLMPLPFTEEAVHYVAGRIRQVQDQLEQRIAVENVSYYAAPGARMAELDFLLAVLEEADCDLLLDVNNLYVNSINHRYDSHAFLAALPAERVTYLHVAGHYREADDLIIDTHGAAVVDPVWSLLAETYRRLGDLPTLLERDFNIPPLPELLTEVEQIRSLQQIGREDDERASA